MEAQSQFWAALEEKDAAGFERVLADDFVARSPGRPDQDRAAFVRTLTRFPAEVLAVGSENLAIHLLDNVAVVSGVQAAEVCLASGQVVANSIAITNIYQQQDGRWRMKLAHAVQLS